MFPLKDNIPLARFPLVTAVLVAINVVVYVLSIRHGGDFFGGPSDSVSVHYGAIPYELTHPGSHCEVSTAPGPVEGFAASVSCHHGATGAGGPPAWQTVFTSIFMHGGFATILANTIAVAIFGPNVEDATGRLRFLAFYLLGAIVSIAAAVLLAPNSAVPVFAGAGAVAAVLGGYLLLYRRARVLSIVFVPFLGTIVALPALLFAGLWLLAQLCFGAAGLANPVDGDWAVAFAALVVALAFGLASIRLFVSRDRESAKGLQTPPRPVY
jgi:membrane associated rhomboid family serine protease